MDRIEVYFHSPVSLPRLPTKTSPFVHLRCVTAQLHCSECTQSVPNAGRKTEKPADCTEELVGHRLKEAFRALCLTKIKESPVDYNTAMAYLIMGFTFCLPHCRVDGSDMKRPTEKVGAQ